ncbi:substrate-binding domain-containing protein [Mycolicibacterium komossense]|uniref:Substrate-binding domain-containing protein n=1 Tax=Mycolicibacterium komossense TaxID=1779 RepID=A0ABT3C6Q1_9MYCO|nr:substrate-binding domain-containing protein [Mycolicibacterium komossense]MCV7225142.1 substrate-binding domain-containing protein [Mycolicibacterium komossense]
MSSSSGPEDRFDPTVISTAPYSGNSADWVSWDFETCKFAPATDHPKEWHAELRKANGDFTVGFGAQDTTLEVNVTMNDSMTKAADATGVKLAFADYKFPDTTAPVEAARSIALREPAVVVSNNQVDTLLGTINKVYSDACIPVVQVVTASEGTVLFGPSNPDMGALEGQRLVDHARSHNWTAENTTLFTTFFSPAGPEVAKRASECQSTVEKAFPGIKKVDHDTTSTNSLTLQSAFTDVLTAHPDAQNILVCTIADAWALADANALKQAGRHTNAAVTGVNGGSAVLNEIKAGNTALVGTVDLGAAQWGDYWVPLAADIAAGKPVPAEIYAPIKMLPQA